jgi:hypothetical protein
MQGTPTARIRQCTRIRQCVSKDVGNTRVPRGSSVLSLLALLVQKVPVAADDDDFGHHLADEVAERFHLRLSEVD